MHRVKLNWQLGLKASASCGFLQWEAFGSLFLQGSTQSPRSSRIPQQNSYGNNVIGFVNALYFSIITATTLGYGDIAPIGWLRLFVAIEVLGGILLAGLAISAIVAAPSRQTRKAGNACRGWWFECCDLPQGRRFFSVSLMTPDGDIIRKFGFNHDPNGRMDQTRFAAQIITGYFPTLISIYQNDRLSLDYTEGVYVFEMEMDGTGQYRSYVGSCYDATHGRRDRIVARKIDDKEFTRKAASGTLTNQDLRTIAANLFADLGQSNFALGQAESRT